MLRLRSVHGSPAIAYVGLHRWRYDISAGGLTGERFNAIDIPTLGGVCASQNKCSLWIVDDQMAGYQGSSEFRSEDGEAEDREHRGKSHTRVDPSTHHGDSKLFASPVPHLSQILKPVTPAW